MDRRRRDQALAKVPRLHIAARILTPQQHRFVLRPNQFEALTRFQQESARGEDPKAEEEVQERPQQDLL